MNGTILRRIVRRDTRPQLGGPNAERILRDVFGFSHTNTLSEAAHSSVCYHWQNVIEQHNAVFTFNPELGTAAAQICDVVLILKQKTDLTINDLHAYLKAHPFPWMAHVDNSENLDHILQYAIQLWLFARIDLSKKGNKLSDLVKESLTTVKGASSASLWPDFSAATLRKRAGFDVVFTDDVRDHLSFYDEAHIQIFGRTSIMERYRTMNSPESSVYPTNLQEEYLRTISLLWPYENQQARKQMEALQEEYGVDLEVGPSNVRDEDRRALRAYPFFGERLNKIQTLSQTRELERTNSRAFKAAVWGIVLSAAFGFVSMIAGIISTWAGIKSYQLALRQMNSTEQAS